MSDNNITYNTVENLPVLEEVPENTHAIVEVDGLFHRVPGSMLGGGGSGNMLNVCVKHESIENGDGFTDVASCNVTFDELYTAMQTGTLGSVSAVSVSPDRSIGGAVRYIELETVSADNGSEIRVFYFNTDFALRIDLYEDNRVEYLWYD